MRSAAEASPNGSPSRAAWVDLCAAMAEAARRRLARGARAYDDGWSGARAFAGTRFGAGGELSWYPLRACAPAAALAPDGFSALDVGQNRVGDCYFLAALAALAACAPAAVEAALITGALGDDGLLGVRFWVGERWVWVWLDDTLPCDGGAHVRLPADGRGLQAGEPRPADGTYGHPFGAFNAARAGAWPAVLEKAWARLHGSYTDIDGGRVQACDAFSPFPPMRLLPHALPGTQLRVADEPADALWAKMRGWAARGWPMTAGAPAAAPAAGAGGAGAGHAVDAEGIVANHAVSLLRVFELERGGQPQPLRLVQCRNPWGASGSGGASGAKARVAEWRGAYSDADAAAWTPALRAATGYDPDAGSSEADGVFWMPFADFARKFATLNVTPAIALANDGGAWHKAVVRGAFAGRGGFADCAHVFVSPHAACEVHALLVADGGDALGRARGDQPTVVVRARRVLDGGVSRALTQADFFSRRLEPCGDGVAGAGVAKLTVAADPARGALAILVEASGGGGGGGGGAPATHFTLSVCAEAPFDLRVAALAGGGVSEPVAKVSDVRPGEPDPLPPVPDTF
jgi:hypothetical protein